jgi:hypothetical protein
MKPEKQVTDAVEKAQSILADYIHPGPRDCEETVQKLITVLDDGSLIEAVDEVKNGWAGPERPEDPPDPSPKIVVLDESGAVTKLD